MKTVIYKGFIFEAVANKGFVDNENEVVYINLAALTKSDLQKASNLLKGEGYDVRGADDVFKILSNYKTIEKDGVTYVHIRSFEWGLIIARAIGIKGLAKETKDEGLLERVLKAIRADKVSGIHIGSTIHSGTAYLLPNGNTIDFSTSGGTRADDHRIINGYMDKEFKTGTDGMEYFLKNTGAIRVIPEGPGIDIKTKPTDIQVNKIANYVNSNKNNEFVLDVYSSKFGRKAKRYNAGVSGNKVKSDIIRFYNSGTFGLDFIGDRD